MHLFFNLKIFENISVVIKIKTDENAIFLLVIYYIKHLFSRGIFNYGKDQQVLPHFLIVPLTNVFISWSSGYCTYYSCKENISEQCIFYFWKDII